MLVKFLPIPKFGKVLMVGWRLEPWAGLMFAGTKVPFGITGNATGKVE